MHEDGRKQCTPSNGTVEIKRRSRSPIFGSEWISHENIACREPCLLLWSKARVALSFLPLPVPSYSASRKVGPIRSHRCYRVQFDWDADIADHPYPEALAGTSPGESRSPQLLARRVIRRDRPSRTCVIPLEELLSCRHSLQRIGHPRYLRHATVPLQGELVSRSPHITCMDDSRVRQWYTDDGAPIGGGCRRQGICEFVHPSDPGWHSTPPSRHAASRQQVRYWHEPQGLSSRVASESSLCHRLTQFFVIAKRAHSVICVLDMRSGSRLHILYLYFVLWYIRS